MKTSTRTILKLVTSQDTIPINDTQWTYCDMAATSCLAGVGGGCIQIVNFNITARDECPTGCVQEPSMFVL